MGRLEDDLVAEMQLSAKGREAEEDRLSHFIPPSQSLSERLIPYKYLNQYENLLKKDKAKAKAFFDLHSIPIPQPKVVDKHELARQMLEKVGQPIKPNELKRRI
jgi:hypothetical protein